MFFLRRKPTSFFENYNNNDDDDENDEDDDGDGDDDDDDNNKHMKPNSVPFLVFRGNICSPHWGPIVVQFGDH